MKTVIRWLWLLPLPLTFAFELLTGAGWLPVVGNVVALTIALPILVRTQTAHAHGRHRGPGRLWLAALGLLIALIPVALASTMSLTVLWLSLVTAVMLARWFSTRLQLLLLACLSVGNVIVPGLMYGDGLTFAFGASTVIVAALSLGLLLRMIDRSLLERHATAAEAERRRMATELHDLVAHEVTGIVVLSQAASRSENPEVLRTALTTIEESGTRALAEIRSLVSNTSTDPGARSPIASVLQSLRDRVESFGHQESMSLDFDESLAEAVPSSLWPVLDRVLAEALTNVRRHAGAAAPVGVGLRTTASAPGASAGAELILTVTNGLGRGGIGTGGGSGLCGLRERLDHVGGHLHAGPDGDGGWKLEARIPWDPTMREGGRP